jgi:O-antigen/teichoic acid export membrane protein
MSPLAIYQQAFYPPLSRAITLSERSPMLKNYTKITFLTGSLLSVILFFYAGTLIITVFGQPFIESAALLKILAPALILMYINLSFSIPLIAWGYEKKVLKTVFVAGLVNLILNLMFIPKYGMYTVAYVTLLTEFIVAVGLTYYIYKVVKKTYFTNLAILTTISVLSFGIPYLFLDINFILNISISFISFILLILATKQIEIRQIKSLFGKTNE